MTVFNETRRWEMKYVCSCKNSFLLHQKRLQDTLCLLERRLGCELQLILTRRKKYLCFCFTHYGAQYTHPTPALRNICIPENVDQIKKASTKNYFSIRSNGLMSQNAAKQRRLNGK